MMIRNLILLLCFAFFSVNAVSEWRYSKASSALDNGDYAYAQELMRTMLVNDPHRADLLYDLGVASYKNKEFAQAHAYFKSASEVENGAPALKEQALYNLGNASVQLNQLSDAIVHYERALELNEQNEFAQHNLEVVKKMLDEQHPFDKLRAGEQQQDQQKQDQKNDQNQQHPFDKLRAGDQQQNNQEQNQGGDQQKDQKDSSKGDDGKENESNSGGQQHPSTQLGTGAKDGKDQNNQQKKEKNDQGPSSNLGTGKNDGDRKQENSKKTDENPGAEQAQQNQKKNEPQKKDVNQNVDADKLPSAQLGTGRAGEAGRADQNLAPEDKWILQVLDRREDAEKKTNKELIRATVDKKLAGQDGKNCW